MKNYAQIDVILITENVIKNKIFHNHHMELYRLVEIHINKHHNNIEIYTH